MTVAPASYDPCTSTTNLMESPQSDSKVQPNPPHLPVAKRVRVEHEAHGDKRVDDYHWLRDRENPDTIKYLQEWNAYTAQAMQEKKGLIETLSKEIIGRMEPDLKTVPFPIGPYSYYVRMEEGKDHPFYCRQPIEGGNEQVLLDGNAYAETLDYFKVKAMEPSPNGRYVAFMVDTDGSQFGKIVILDTEEGKFVDEEIKSSDGGIVWNTRSDGFWYTTVDDQMRSDKLFVHRIGTAVSEDPLIKVEKDPLFDLGIGRDKPGKYLILSSSSKDTSEVSLGSLDDPSKEFETMQAREEGLKYFLAPGVGFHYVLVSKDKSNWGLFRVEDGKWARENWVELEASKPDVDLVNVEVFKDYVAILKRNRGLKKVEIRSLKDESVHVVAMPQEIGDIDFEHNDDWDTSLLRFTFDSPVTPLSTYHYNMETRSLELLQQRKAGDFDPSLYTSERVWAIADDGTKVPISLFYKKGTPRDGSAPLYLYGYGSYGVTYDPYFSISNASFLERGVCFAIAHVRGGGDLGRQWYEQGSMLKKRNTFTDFNNCAEHLIKQGFTSPDRLVIRGGSAGGLLMGAVINMRPDLYKACLAEVPFVDVVTTMFDESLPLTTQEWIEWGNPNEKEYYKYMKSYSPVDNVFAQDYPSLYVVAGLNDKQVSYHEPAKWVAKLAEFKTDSNPLLFRVNMGAGHHGSSGRYAAIEEMSPDIAFLLGELGFTD